MTTKPTIVIPAGLPAAKAELLPPILAGNATPSVVRRVQKFIYDIPTMLDEWVEHVPSKHSQRAYRYDIMHFIEFMKISWPDQAILYLTIRAKDVQRYAEAMRTQKKPVAPSTLNRRLCSLSAFYKFLDNVAREQRLPVNLGNPAHAQFVRREDGRPVEETKDLSITRARQLMNMPKGESVLEYRDRALLHFVIYTGVRLSTLCRVNIRDFNFDEPDKSSVFIREKGRLRSRREIGLHSIAALTIDEYLKVAGLTSGPLFPVQHNSRSNRLGDRAFTESGMYRLLLGYFSQLPGAMKYKKVEKINRQPDGSTIAEIVEVPYCIYSPHSIRATTVTILLNAGVDPRKVQELAGHKLLKTTMAYSKKKFAVQESASHEVPI